VSAKETETNTVRTRKRNKPVNSSRHKTGTRTGTRTSRRPGPPLQRLPALQVRRHRGPLPPTVHIKTEVPEVHRTFPLLLVREVGDAKPSWDRLPQPSPKTVAAKSQSPRGPTTADLQGGFRRHLQALCSAEIPPKSALPLPIARLYRREAPNGLHWQLKGPSRSSDLWVLLTSSSACCVSGLHEPLLLFDRPHCPCHPSSLP